MYYDPAELEAIREDSEYQECVKICRRTAIDYLSRDITRPPKIVNDRMIEFYGSEKNNNCDSYGKYFSNCFVAKIKMDDAYHLSTEHYYQKSKFDISVGDLVVAEWCKKVRKTVQEQIECNELVREQMSTMSPVAVAKFGQTCTSAPIRGDWDRVRNRYMWDALVAKFTQLDNFREALVCTGTRVLIERTPTDKYWGINNDGKGENTLGVMLMAIRSQLE